MKTISCAILFSFLFFQSYTQNHSVICGKVKSGGKYLINFYEPINGFYNLAFFDSTKQNSSLTNTADSFYKSISLVNPSFVNVYFRDQNEKFITRTDLLLFPGDSLHLDINLDVDNPTAFSYEGSNASGQKLFNEINYQPYDKFVPIFDALDKLPGNKEKLAEEIEDVVSILIKRFDTLQTEAKVSSQYIQYMQISFRTLFSYIVIDKFLRPGKKREILSKLERDEIIDTLYKGQPPTDKRLSGLYLAPFYINQYYNYLAYKKYNLNSIKPLKDGSKVYKIRNRQFLIPEDFVPFTYIKNSKEQEDLWGLEMVGALSWFPGKYDERALLQYDSIFPNNRWKAVLKKQFETKYTLKNIGYNLQSPVVFIDSFKNYNTINTLLSALPKEKPVFVDLWASWCGPCIAAFGYNKQLDSFLLKNNIEKLYISFDDETDSAKWRTATHKYSLGGYHIIANNLLKEDIKKTIYHSSGNKGMGIPRYVLINKKGEIVVDDADSPEDFILLMEQINKTLLKD
ncbi:MAG: redoxin family protein [Ferruginibacter sp.]